MKASFENLDIEQNHPLLEDDHVEKRITSRSAKSTSWCRRLAIVSYSLSVLMLIASLVYPTDLQCARRLSTWSPMLDAIEYEWRPLTNNIGDAKYRGKPSTELEKAWFDLWAYGSLGIQTDQLPRLNKSIESKNWSMIPDALGGGVRAYFEGFHQLHCVDLIRQYSYRDQYDYSDLPAWDQSDAMRLNHVEHCIEILRIVLMCAADTTPYLLSVDKQGETWAHANSQQKCRKWSSLANWADRNIVEPYNATEEKIKHMEDHHGSHNQ